MKAIFKKDKNAKTKLLEDIKAIHKYKVWTI